MPVIKAAAGALDCFLPTFLLQLFFQQNSTCAKIEKNLTEISFDAKRYEKVFFEIYFPLSPLSPL